MQVTIQKVRTLTNVHDMIPSPTLSWFTSEYDHVGSVVGLQEICIDGPGPSDPCHQFSMIPIRVFGIRMDEHAVQKPFSSVDNDIKENYTRAGSTVDNEP